jgi:hypothetical protein
MMPLTILIVDDEPLMRLPIVDALWLPVLHDRQPVERGA